MLGIRLALAGGFYPVLVFSGWWICWIAYSFVDALVNGGWRGDQVLSALPMVFGIAFVAAQAFIVGFLWAGVLSLFFVPTIAYLRRLLDWPAHLDVAGKLSGGLVAYLATLPAALGASLMATDTFDFLPALFVFAHCGLAIAMGQAAGCLAAVADLRRRRRGKLAASGLRFGVWQLLALTVPVAVVLSLLKAADMLNQPLARPPPRQAPQSAVGGWFHVEQSAAHGLWAFHGEQSSGVNSVNCSTWNNLGWG
jgi:hypothetical protein